MNNILSLDLEMNQPSGKIIQIGYIIGNVNTGDILEEKSLFVNPEEQLSDYIITLTGIKQNQVDDGTTLKEAYDELKETFKQYDCFRNPITWGGGDSECLRNQLNLDNEMFLFGRRWIDVKTLYVSYRVANGLSHQGGLAKAMTKMGLQFSGKKHNATCDAKNTFKMYLHMLKYFKEK